MFNHRNHRALATFRPALTLHRQIDRLLNEWPARDMGWHPSLDIRETDAAFVVTAELPGVASEDVKISLEDSILTVSGEKKQEKHEENTQYTRLERAFGSFERSFKLPSTVDADRIAAAYKDGVLTITLPKIEKEKPREISIDTV